MSYFKRVIYTVYILCCIM